MSSARATSFEKEHLWMYLLALGFEPGPATVACGKIVSHTHLGVHMFDKQNRDAFQIVSYFLFQTLDQSFTKEVFKHCWPPFDRKSETEFRKHCYEWLKKISVECGSNFPQVVGSLFLSPGGSKFIHLMYHFARFVAIKYIQSNSKNSSIRFTEPFIGKSQDLHKCIARCHVARNRFLQILQREDCVIRKYQENAQMELCDDQINIQEKIQKLHIGNVYEAGKLNLLTVIQLLNEVLKIMKYECCQSDQAKLTLDLHFLEKEAKIQKERLSDLKQMRCKIKEDLTTIRQSVVEKQGEWHKKWKAFLGVSPFSLINGSTPAVDLLPPMSPLSFDPASEEVYATSILLKYPALLPDTLKQQNQENDCGRASDMLGTGYDLANSSTSVSLQPASSSDKSTVTLFEKDVTVKTPREKDKAVSKRIPKFEVEGFSSSTTAKTVESSAFGECLPTKKSSHFQKEQDHLVEEVARAVLSDSPQPSEGKEVKLEELIDSLVSNPFLTRKQIPRTPENLINEIRSSWRKAVETDNRSADPIQMDPESEVLPESSPVLHNQGEFDKNNFFLATTVSSQSHLPEEEFITDCLVSVPQKHASYIDKSATQNQSDLSNKKITCKQNLECTLQNKLLATSQRQTFSPAIGSRTDVMGSSEEEHIKVLNHSKVSHQEPSIYKTMLWDSFQISSGINSGSFKDTNFSILHETLPEEMDCLSLNSSSCTESSFKLEPNSPMPSGIFPEDVEVKQTTPKSDLNLKAICSRYEALKKSLSKKREGTHLSNPEMFGRYKLELSPAPEDMQIDDMLNILDTKDVHIDYTKPSLRMSLGERKRSLSPLIKFSPVEQKSRPTVPCSFGELLPNLEEEEILNKRFEAKESSADLI
ncbi:HAUS augmin-like complex subunit 6 isoform X5 [Erinaceus europaeus]|uniref:HAUS augmin-like complex subunit 6 isoform X5 n=1 Tax=Erinaceus europaeus TaxID=9365 RepID=A0ABM3Y3G9_ERIEU|nr:HAUS augmin-like complex subunit 6 isoform X5 [Erinaceus europaeus]